MLYDLKTEKKINI